MPAFPKPNPTETDPVASPAVSVEAAARADADALLAPKASPAFTGNPTAPTQSAGNNSTRLATTAYADAAASSAAGTKALPILPWTTGTAYLRGQPVTNGGHTYTANDAHTSGATFAGDLGSHWTLLPVTASDVGAISTANLDTTTTLGTSDTEVPSQNAVKTYVDSATPADASTSVKGITKLSVAPVSASAPIAVGTNDPRVVANVVVAKQTADFTQTGVQASMVQLGTVSASITITAGSSVRVRVTGKVSMTDGASVVSRLNIDSGASYVNLGRQVVPAEGATIDATAVITGLAAGAHTVIVQYTKNGGGTIYLRGSTQPTLERLEIHCEEIAA